MATKKVTKKTAAVASPQKGKRHNGSMSDQIDKLELGQSVAVAQRFPFEEMIDPEFEIKDSLNKLRSAQAAYVARITDDLDTRKFKVESGTYLSDDKTAVIVSVVTTRVT